MKKKYRQRSTKTIVTTTTVGKARISEGLPAEPRLKSQDKVTRTTRATNPETISEALGW